MIKPTAQQNYKQCSISILDNISDPDISFDAKGRSNYFHYYHEVAKRSIIGGFQGANRVQEITNHIKKDRRRKQYDCILGVSGGVDSTYLALVAKRLGLRVLCVHFDNGWNSELAVQNIQNIVETCEFDLYTYVIDWTEFKDIQLAYFKANVVDIEAVTDIAIFSALEMIRSKFKVPHILDGRNVVTEAILPKSWYCKNHSNLRDIHNKFGTIKRKAYPLVHPIRRRLSARLNPSQNWRLLDLVEYNKNEAKLEIQKELNWTDYGGKHYESVFTRFYQGFILPNKFKIDKRKAHYSNLIFSGQMSKPEALEKMKEPIYPEPLFQQDYPFVLKKLGVSRDWFEAYMQNPQTPHSEFELKIDLKTELILERSGKHLLT